MKPDKRIAVLYADSNEEACEMLKILLGFSGIDLWCVSTAAETLEAVRDNHFDLCLLETRFPDSSGFDLCQRLRELYPHTPIVFYSGDGFAEDSQKGLAAGVAAYIVKPASDTIAPIIYQFATRVTETAGLNTLTNRQ